MPSTTERSSHGLHEHHGGDLDLRPYFFHRDASDVLAETFQSLFDRRTRTGEGERAGGVGVIEEQRKTLFAHDEFLQQLFDGDFEAFSIALDHPEQLHERLAKRIRRTTDAPSRTAWSEGERTGHAWESQRHEHEHAHEQEEPHMEEDPVYDRAFQWACRTDRWGRRLAATLKREHVHLTRILANAILVPTKVAFGFSAAVDDDVSGYEVAIVGYRQAAIFLQRVIESLGVCYGNRIGRPQTVHDLLDEGRDLLADIESRIAEYESEIKYRGGTSS